ncbi:MAG: polymer-forming cytoskeletal protein [Firmicutes bacterium]|nr:polymer-forming cytoskeletal protein [Bacillota bacterium]
MKINPKQAIADFKRFVSDKVGISNEVLKIDTLIGKKTTVEGDVAVIGNCKIDGKVNGDVKVSGDLVIGGDAQINGGLSACNIIIAGVVTGNIAAKGQLCVKKAAHITGEHTAQSLAAEEGCSFVGNCNILGKHGRVEP